MDYEQDYYKNLEFFRENPIGSAYNEISEMKSTGRKNSNNSYYGKKSHSRLLIGFGFFLDKGQYKREYNKPVTIKPIISMVVLLNNVTKRQSHYGVIIVNTKYTVKGKITLYRFLWKSERMEKLQIFKKTTYPEKVTLCRFF